MDKCSNVYLHVVFLLWVRVCCSLSLVVYADETYPSEAIREELTVKLGLTDRQLQMWFCHRRLKDKKEAAGMAANKPRAAGGVGKRMDSPQDEMLMAEAGSERVSRSGSGSGSGSGSSQFDNRDDIPMVPIRYHELSRTVMERRVIACIEAQLGEPLREDGPILGVDFDELPPGAFGTPIGTSHLVCPPIDVSVVLV